MGDVLMIMEFSSSFSKVLHTNKFFPQGLTLDLMERALTEKEVSFVPMVTEHPVHVYLFFLKRSSVLYLQYFNWYFWNRL